MRRTIFIIGILLMILTACSGTAPSNTESKSSQYGVVTIYTEPT